MSASRRAARALRAPLLSALALALVALTACGTPAPDLFVVTRDGTVPGAKLRLLVSDQSVRCNDGPTKALTSAQTIQARELSKDLIKFQDSRAPIQRSAPAQIFSFSVRNEKGTLHYPDSVTRPVILPRITLFVRQTATGICGLRR